MTTGNCSSTTRHELLARLTAAWDAAEDCAAKLRVVENVSIEMDSTTRFGWFRFADGFGFGVSCDDVADGDWIPIREVRVPNRIRAAKFLGELKQAMEENNSKTQIDIEDAIAEIEQFTNELDEY